MHAHPCSKVVIFRELRLLQYSQLFTITPSGCGNIQRRCTIDGDAELFGLVMVLSVVSPLAAYTATDERTTREAERRRGDCLGEAGPCWNACDPDWKARGGTKDAAFSRRRGPFPSPITLTHLSARAPSLFSPPLQLLPCAPGLEHSFIYLRSFRRRAVRLFSLLDNTHL